METTCPPIPTLQEFDQLYHNGEYILVDVEDLQTGEKVLFTQPNWSYLVCVEIGENNVNYLQTRNPEHPGLPFSNQSKNYINSVRGTNIAQLYFRINPRKNFDKASAMIKTRIHNNTIGNVSDAMKNVMGNQDLYNLIGNNLAPGKHGKGGRRKTKAKKNKRNSTRRIRRKYKR